MEGGEIIGLVGELGAGKTAFVRGMAQGLGVGSDAWVRSPTFTLINEYRGRLPLYHIDLYRVANRLELEDLNLRDYLFGDGVTVIEWFERLPPDEAGEFLQLSIALRDGSSRELAFEPQGERYDRIVHDLKSSGRSRRQTVER
jgi:tRNA threonylcarbamoyladenosine biosynthesis protein TsaE